MRLKELIDYLEQLGHSNQVKNEELESAYTIAVWIGKLYLQKAADTKSADHFFLKAYEISSSLKDIKAERDFLGLVNCFYHKPDALLQENPYQLDKSLMAPEVLVQYNFILSLLKVKDSCIAVNVSAYLKKIRIELENYYAFPESRRQYFSLEENDKNVSLRDGISFLYGINNAKKDLEERLKLLRERKVLSVFSIK